MYAWRRERHPPHTMTRDADVADASDAEYARAMTVLRRRVDAVGDKATRIRLRAWIRAFERPERATPLVKNQIKLIKLLSAMLRVGRLDRPFTRAPPEGRLRRFDPDDAVGFDLDADDDVEVGGDGGGDGGGTRAETRPTDAETRMMDAEASAVASASARVTEGRMEPTRGARREDAKSRVETLEAEVKRLRAKTRAQEERIETLTRQLAAERESRLRPKSAPKKSASPRRASAANAAADPSDFDAYIDTLVAETARFRATLAGARARA